MKNNFIYAALLSSLLVLQACDNSSSIPAVLRTELTAIKTQLNSLQAESEIRRKLQQYMTVLNAADWDEYLHYFAEDSQIVMTEGTVKGKAAIKERMANASARMAQASQGQEVRLREDILSNIQVEVSGDKAKAQSRFTFISQNGNGGFEVYGSGMYLDEWILEGGQWLIASRTVDYDMLRSSPAR